MSTDEAAQVVAKRWQGIKVAVVGVVVAAVGFVLAWFFGFKPGSILLFVGWVVGMSGGFIHVRQMFREARLPRSDVHPRARHPWGK